MRYPSQEALLPVTYDNVVVQKLGFDEIRDWVDSGARLP